MNVLCHLIRFLGCGLGLFMMVSGTADVLGFVPHSNETPPWTARLIANSPSMFVGAVLLVPVRHFLLGAKVVALGCGFAVANMWALLSAVDGIAAYMSGGRHWGIIPASLVPLAIISANTAALAFLRWQATRPPGNSFKPTSIRDAA